MFNQLVLCRGSISAVLSLMLSVSIILTDYKHLSLQYLKVVFTFDQMSTLEEITVGIGSILRFGLQIVFAICVQCFVLIFEIICYIMKAQRV